MVSSLDLTRLGRVAPRGLLLVRGMLVIVGLKMLELVLRILAVPGHAFTPISNIDVAAAADIAADWVNLEA